MAKLSEAQKRDLRRQHQAFRHAPERGVMGDCYRTAVACVLGVDRDAVPHSHDDMTGDEASAFIDAWLRPQGLTRIFIPVAGDDFEEIANAIYPRGGGLSMIVTGRGPRDVNHVVVVHGVDDFWCPILGAVDAHTALAGPALPNGYFWAEWIVGVPAGRSALEGTDAS